MDAGPVLVMPRSARAVMGSLSVAIAEVRLAWPAGGSTWAELTRTPVAAGSTVPVAVKTTRRAHRHGHGRVDVAAARRGARAAARARARPRHAGQRRRERVGDRGATRVARPERVGDGDGVGRRQARDHAVDAVGLRDVEIGHRRGDRRVGGRARADRRRRRTRHRRRVGDRIGRRIAGRDREGRRDRAGRGGGQRAEGAREGRRAIPGVRDERQAGGRRVGERDAGGIRRPRIRDGDRVDDIRPGHGGERGRSLVIWRSAEGVSVTELVAVLLVGIPIDGAGRRRDGRRVDEQAGRVRRDQAASR